MPPDEFQERYPCKFPIPDDPSNRDIAWMLGSLHTRLDSQESKHQDQEERLRSLEKNQWKLGGIAGVFAAIVGVIASLFGG